MPILHPQAALEVSAQRETPPCPCLVRETFTQLPLPALALVGRNRKKFQQPDVRNADYASSGGVRVTCVKGDFPLPYPVRDTFTQLPLPAPAYIGGAR